MSNRPSDRGRPALEPIKDEIRTLADPDGEFVVRCGQRGDRPVPVDDCRFPDRDSAARAARLTGEYRRRLREWDERTPFCAPIVHEEGTAAVSHNRCADADPFDGSLADRVRANDPVTSESTVDEEG